jgi:hypothetical protein
MKAEHYNVATDQTFSNVHYFKQGFSIASNKTLTLNTPVRVSGNISMDSGSILSLGGDLTFASDAYLATLSSDNSKINGNGYALVMTSSLVIPSGKALHVSGNTIIDGQGNDLVLSDGDAQLKVDANATLTLSNMTIRLLSGTGTPQLTGDDDSSRIALQNVTMYMDGDFDFVKGYLYIHDDVIVRGKYDAYTEPATATTYYNYKLSYESVKPLVIGQNSMLYFDLGTVFKFNPGGTGTHAQDVATEYQRFLLRFNDFTSVLSFNGSLFDVPTNGVRLSHGTMIFDNKCWINNKDGDGVVNTTAANGIRLGDGSSATNDVNVFLLSGARVEVNGYFDFYDKEL